VKRTRRLGLGAVALLATACLMPPLAAQDVDPEAPIDRVVAVVGTAAITFTQLQEEFFTRFSVQGQQPPTDPEVVRTEMRRLVDTLINAELLYQQGLRDTTVVVTSLEISDAVDQTMRAMRQRVASEQVFQTELRRAGFLGIDDYRRWLMEQQGREFVRERYQAKLRQEGVLAPVAPTEREIRAYYDQNRSILPERPPTATLKQLVILPVADSAAKAGAFQVADSLARAIREGADFGVAARRFSQDPASAPQGGEMDWFRRGQMVRPFEEAAFGLPRGTISNPVETVYGFHVIQVERVQPTEVKVRHILITPELDSVDVAAARRLADSLHALILAGASFDSLQALHHDPSEEREAIGMIVDSLGADYIAAIEGLPPGGTSPVFALRLAGGGGTPKFAIVRVVGRAPAGPEPYDQLRERIRIRLGDIMGQQRYFEEMRRKVHIEIREL
jgi:peptidyl-prolyl cis-trans isomerase SurA